MSNEVKYGELQGVDANIEISLFEYGIAWQYSEDGSEVRFWGEVSMDDDGGYFNKFDWGCYRPDINCFDWADFEDVASFCGMTLAEWLEVDFPHQVYDLYCYYGRQVFGESYGSAFEFDPETETFSYVGI